MVWVSSGVHALSRDSIEPSREFRHARRRLRSLSSASNLKRLAPPRSVRPRRTSASQNTPLQTGCTSHDKMQAPMTRPLGFTRLMSAAILAGLLSGLGAIAFHYLADTFGDALFRW